MTSTCTTQTGSSSNEEMDSCSAQEIVSRLASKYLLKSSTDTENEKENNRKKAKPFDPYDADLEYSTTDMESDCRVSGNQNSASEMETNSKKVHSQTKKTNKKGHKKPVQRKNTKGKQNTQTETESKKTQSGVTKNRGKTQRKKVFGQSTGSNTESTIQSQTSDTSNPTSSEATTKSKSGKRSVSFSQLSMEYEGLAMSTSAQSQPGDSGFYVTPPGKSTSICFLPQLSASDTSTPASVKSSKLQLDDSCFGFENIISPEPLLISPVNRVSPTSNVSSSFECTSKEPSFQRSSVDASSLLGSMASRPRKKRPLDNDTNRLSDHNQQPKKIKRPKSKLKKDSVNWEAMMSAEFEDVEMHELTIES
ncbi:uncharacterized protein LOC117105638 isoform X2 [Anneissia japonica]|uniref:uncharacterized protein LOC117105638 isoform X2 n=1 Tax=Anneissia japonica TaxID=1529436 RepID=UPI00142553BC|nr:uncharacterized protein LOC117105638 isoform X2 [Anneissia japonica]